MTTTSRNQTEMRATRQNLIDEILTMESLAGHEVVAQITEGILLQGPNGYTVLKPIVKKAGFDYKDAINEFNEREENAKARAEALAKKKAEALAKKAEAKK